MKTSQTYAQLKELANLYTGNESLEQIAVRYQQEQDAILLSYVLCECIDTIVYMNTRYFGLTDTDIESFGLEELHKAMMHFKPNGGAKLKTFFSRYLKNRLRMETQANSYDKRSANNKAYYIDHYSVRNGFSQEYDPTEEHEDLIFSQTNIEMYEVDEYEQVEWLIALAENPDITENEYKYCEIILKEVRDPNNVNNSEIAKRLNISSAGLHYIKKSLQKKMGFVVDAINI